MVSENQFIWKIYSNICITVAAVYNKKIVRTEIVEYSRKTTHTLKKIN